MAIPVLTEIATYSSPPAGGLVGGTLYWIFIYGSHFTDGGGVSAVSLGAGITIDYFTIWDDLTIEFGIIIDPAAVPGTRTLEVTNGDGTGSLVDAFTIYASHIPVSYSLNPMDPDFGYAGDSGTSIDIWADYCTGTISLDLGADVTIDSLTVVYDNYVQAVISIDGAATEGWRNLTITNAAGDSVPVQAFYVYGPAPIVSKVTPSVIDRGETVDVTVTGQYFTSVINYDVGDLTVNSWSVVSDTEIIMNVTAGAAATLGNREVWLDNGQWGMGTGILLIFPFANVKDCSSSCTVVSSGGIAGGFIGGIYTAVTGGGEA
jgi:hypothetical protein